MCQVRRRISTLEWYFTHLSFLASFTIAVRRLVAVVFEWILFQASHLTCESIVALQKHKCLFLKGSCFLGSQGDSVDMGGCPEAWAIMPIEAENAL